MKWQIALEQWRNARQLTVSAAFYSMIEEEILELSNAETIEDEIDAYADIIVFTENQLDLEGFDSLVYTSKLTNPPETKVEAIERLQKTLDSYCYGANNFEIFQKLYSICAYMIEQLGYSVSLVMKETIKEISSRKQDPEQAENWAINGPSGKWMKDKNQASETLYKAQYKLCKAKK